MRLLNTFYVCFKKKTTLRLNRTYKYRNIYTPQKTYQQLSNVHLQIKVFIGKQRTATTSNWCITIQWVFILLISIRNFHFICILEHIYYVCTCFNPFQFRMDVNETWSREKERVQKGYVSYTYRKCAFYSLKQKGYEWKRIEKKQQHITLNSVYHTFLT